jgi:hypothetical protein
MFHIRNPRDFWAGVMFIAFGIAAMVIARDYPFGSAARMGPGYFPTVLGGILAAIGAVVSVQSLAIGGEKVGPWAWSALVLVLGAVLLFGVLLQYLGLVLCTFILIAVSSIPAHDKRWKEVLISGVVLSALALGLFIYGLGLQFPVWPAFLPWN